MIGLNLGVGLAPSTAVLSGDTTPPAAIWVITGSVIEQHPAIAPPIVNGTTVEEAA